MAGAKIITDVIGDALRLAGKEAPDAASEALKLAERERQGRSMMQGYNVDAWHGSPRDIPSFKTTYSSPEGYYGSNHYFSSSVDDVGYNYATPEGADIANRAQREAEMFPYGGVDDDNILEALQGLGHDFPDIGDVPDNLVEEALQKIVRDNLGITNEGAIYPVKLRMANPVRVGGKNETFFDITEPYDEIADEYGEPYGKGIDLIQSLRKNAEYYGADPGHAIDKIFEDAIDNGGISASDFERHVRGMDVYNDYDGNSASPGALIADIYKDLGHDSIDMDAYSNFGPRKISMGVNTPGMAGLYPDTRHYIKLDPTGIRSRFAQFDPAQIDSPDIDKANGGRIEKAGAGKVIGDVIGDALRLAGKEAPEAASGIRAYHSSPHDFDKFDLSKIGTGEGNQAYGYGIYAAESPSVSGRGGDYWRQFFNKMKPGPEHSAAGAMFNRKFDRDKAMEGLLKDVEYYTDQAMPGRYAYGPEAELGNSLLAKDYQEAYDILARGDIAGPRTYELNINSDPAHLLDWDKPILDQSTYIQNLISDVLPKYEIKKYGGSPYAMANNKMIEVENPELITGRDAYIIGRMGQNMDNSRDASRAVSSSFNEAGIPGIRYLDGNSRGAGEGTSNYVVFDPSIIDITKKYADGGSVEDLDADIEAALMTARAEKAGGGSLTKAFMELVGPAEREGLQALTKEGSGYTPVPGKPAAVDIPLVGRVESKPIVSIEEAAADYMRKRGRPGEHVVEAFPELDKERARRIAEAYDVMKHDPTDPAVKRSYEAMIDETVDQYNALKNLDLDIRFNPEGFDPYALSPSMGYADLAENRRLWVFPTEQGFGSDVAFDPANNPLLKRVGPVGDLPDATANDLFRVVHDIYGHFGPGNPYFRAPGEERAWLQHSRMYSDEALPAMSSETRGQNSYLNFGPYAKHNAKASGADTIYADQKTGIMPPWAYEKADGGRIAKADGGGSEYPSLENIPSYEEASAAQAEQNAINAYEDWKYNWGDPADIVAYNASNYGDLSPAQQQALLERAYQMDKPEKPMRPVKVDMPLLGGEYELGSARYDLADKLSGLGQLGYDLKTIPGYMAGAFFPPAAWAAEGIDLAEAAASEDPAQLAAAVAFGPFGKYTKAGLLGGMAALEPSEAQSGILGEWAAKASTELADALNLAKKMKKEGASPDEIWNATNWHKTPTVPSRLEDIDRALEFFKANERPWGVGLRDSDYYTYINPKNVTFADRKLSNQPMPIADAIDFPELYKLLPEIKDSVSIVPYARGVRGANYTPGEKTIRIGDVNRPYYSIFGADPYQTSLIHELQHAIDHRGGRDDYSPWERSWDQGTSSDRTIGQMKGFAHTYGSGRKLAPKIKKTPDADARFYLANPGEERARNAEYRFARPELADLPLDLSSDMERALMTGNVIIPDEPSLFQPLTHWNPEEFAAIKKGEPVLNIDKPGYTRPVEWNEDPGLWSHKYYGK
jgi:hypothetical protein